MQIKTTRYHLISVRMAITKKKKKSTNNKCQRGRGEKGTLIHCWQECKLVQPLWRTVWKFLKKLKTDLTYDLTIPLCAYIQRKTWFTRIHAPRCALKHYPQQPRHGGNLNAHPQKMWYTCTMEYYSAIKKSEVMPLADGPRDYHSK